MTNQIPAKPSRLLSFTNKLIIVFQVMTGSVLIIMLLHNNFAEISEQIFPKSSPLMGSKVAEIMMNKWFVIVIAAVIIGAIVKEFYVNSIKKRLIMNFMIFIGIEVMAGIFVKLMFPLVFG